MLNKKQTELSDTNIDELFNNRIKDDNTLFNDDYLQKLVDPAIINSLNKISPKWQLKITEIGAMGNIYYVKIALIFDNIQRENLGFSFYANNPAEAVANAFSHALQNTAALFRINENEVQQEPRKNTGEDQQATQRQIKTIKELLNDPRLTDKEQFQIQHFLVKGMTKKEASDLLDYYYGKREYNGEQWIRTSPGALKGRKPK